MPTTILITGSNGQLGTVLTAALRERYGSDRVLATDLRDRPDPEGRFEVLDVTDAAALNALVAREGITQIYHLAAILSANGEQHPLRSWDVNMTAWLNVLEAARVHGVERVFFPSSIAVFGPDVPRHATPNDANLAPLTAYGISKAAGENWGQYYYRKYGLDVRSLRYPGVIGHQSMPGGGTTDYAVDIYHYAVRDEPYTCFLAPDTYLPMIYMDDAIRATLQLMEAPTDDIRVRTSYNLSGMSFCPREIVADIRLARPDFSVDYRPDHRQTIAAGWPCSIDDAPARRDWGWEPRYNLNTMTVAMLDALGTPAFPP